MIQIDFDNRIYSKEALQRAGENLSHVADFLIVQGDNFTKVSIDNISEETRGLIENEFKNLAIYWIKNV